MLPPSGFPAVSYSELPAMHMSDLVNILVYKNRQIDFIRIILVFK